MYTYTYIYILTYLLMYTYTYIYIYACKFFPRKCNRNIAIHFALKPITTSYTNLRSESSLSAISLLPTLFILSLYPSLLTAPSPCILPLCTPLIPSLLTASRFPSHLHLTLPPPSHPRPHPFASSPYPFASPLHFLTSPPYPLNLTPPPLLPSPPLTSPPPLTLSEKSHDFRGHLRRR